jgi:hypothetical protein
MAKAIKVLFDGCLLVAVNDHVAASVGTPDLNLYTARKHNQQLRDPRNSNIKTVIVPR